MFILSLAIWLMAALSFNQSQLVQLQLLKIINCERRPSACL